MSRLLRPVPRKASVYLHDLAVDQFGLLFTEVGPDPRPEQPFGENKSPSNIVFELVWAIGVSEATEDKLGFPNIDFSGLGFDLRFEDIASNEFRSDVSMFVVKSKFKDGTVAGLDGDEL